MNWYLKVWKSFADFNGRARRKEYWMFTLFNLLVYIVLYVIDNATGTLDPELGIGVLGGLYTLAVLIPGLAVTVRRLHDTSKSGWWILICFVPIVGGLILLVFTVMDSTPGSNEYGENPKGL